MKQDISIQNISRIALPLVVAGIAMNLVGVVDMLFVSRLGEAQLGGTGNGQILYSLLFLIGMGFTTGIQIIIGRRNGEGNYDKIGPIFQQGIYFTLAFGLAMILFIQLAIPGIMRLLFESENVVRYTNEYMLVRGWGILFTLANLLFIAFFVGITKTKIIGWYTPLISGINIVLDYALIFGHFGLPAMGVKGAALASVIASFSGTLILTLYTITRFKRAKYRMFEFEKLSFPEIGHILKVASPIMLQNALSIGAWFSFFVLVERLGERSLAISQIIRGIYIFLMVPVFSLADATNTLVSNLMGQKKYQLILPLVWKITAMGLALNVVLFTLMNIFPEFTIGIFSENSHLVQEAIPSLRVTSLSMFIFTIGMISFRAVSGTGNTQTALWIEAVSISFYLVYVWYVTVYHPKALHIVWASEFIYFGGMIILSHAYLRYRNWQKKII